ncbi:hypothetical protein EDF20_2804 [Frigoribacterium sp. PhB116]|nr:hypothetical protein EDF20_2804 [Frigoribacterium sp. PhB116]
MPPCLDRLVRPTAVPAGPAGPTRDSLTGQPLVVRLPLVVGLPLSTGQILPADRALRGRHGYQIVTRCSAGSQSASDSVSSNAS